MTVLILIQTLNTFFKVSEKQRTCANGYAVMYVYSKQNSGRSSLVVANTKHFIAGNLPSLAYISLTPITIITAWGTRGGLGRGQLRVIRAFRSALEDFEEKRKWRARQAEMRRVQLLPLQLQIVLPSPHSPWEDQNFQVMEFPHLYSKRPVFDPNSSSSGQDQVVHDTPSLY
jgi:hypothetical protein